MQKRVALPAAVLAALLLIPACTMKASRTEEAEPVTVSSMSDQATQASPAAAAAPTNVMPKPAEEKDASAVTPRPKASRQTVMKRSAAAPASPVRLSARSLSNASAVASARGNGTVSGRMGARRELSKVEGFSGDRDSPAAQESNTEEYSRIHENPFLAAGLNPLSTFSIDVDAASYANVRRFLQGNRLPPADAVRIEELINYFDYGYPQPEGDAPFSITTEVAATPWNAKTRLVHVGLQGVRIENDKLPATNLVFLIDVSGSMESPQKLPLLKRAFRLLTDQMRPQDRVAMVVYAGAAGMVLPSTSGKDKAAILEALERLSAGGSTAGGEGLMLAYQVAQKHFIKGGNNRIILATDGDFNVGPSSDGEMVRLIEEKRKSGVFLSILGFGMGNYKDSKMEQMADKGNGNYAYIDNIREARKVLVEEMGGTLVTIAKDVKLQVEFNPAKVEAYRLIGYENRMLRSEDFNDDTKDAGELGAGHSVTALYEVVPKGTRMDLPTVDSLKYRKPAAGIGRESGSDELLTVKFRYKDPNGTRSKLLSRVLTDGGAGWQTASEDFRFSAAAAGFGMLLRGSKHKGELEYAQVLAMAKASAGKDPQGHRAEFIRLVEAAKLLGAGQRLGARGEN